MPNSSKKLKQRFLMYFRRPRRYWRTNLQFKSWLRQKRTQLKLLSSRKSLKWHRKRFKKPEASMLSLQKRLQLFSSVSLSWLILILCINTLWIITSISSSKQLSMQLHRWLSTKDLSTLNQLFYSRFTKISVSPSLKKINFCFHFPWQLSW